MSFLVLVERSNISAILELDFKADSFLCIFYQYIDDRRTTCRMLKTQSVLIRKFIKVHLMVEISLMILQLTLITITINTQTTNDNQDIILGTSAISS